MGSARFGGGLDCGKSAEEIRDVVALGRTGELGNQCIAFVGQEANGSASPEREAGEFFVIWGSGKKAEDV